MAINACLGAGCTGQAGKQSATFANSRKWSSSSHIADQLWISRLSLKMLKSLAIQSPSPRPSIVSAGSTVDAYTDGAIFTAELIIDCSEHNNSSKWPLNSPDSSVCSCGFVV